MKAVIITGGKQYYVSEKDVIYVEKLDANEGDKVVFDKETIIASFANNNSTKNEHFEPMNANFGLLNVEQRFKSKQEKYEFLAKKSLEKISVQID